MIFREGDFVRNDDGFCVGLMPFELYGPRLRLHMTKPREFREEVKMPHVAPEFAVGDGDESGGFFFSNELTDGVVFDGGKCLSGQSAGGKLSTSFFNGGRAQETADDVGTVRRIHLGHDDPHSKNG